MSLSLPQVVVGCSLNALLRRHIKRWPWAWCREGAARRPSCLLPYTSSSSSFDP